MVTSGATAKVVEASQAGGSLSQGLPAIKVRRRCLLPRARKWLQTRRPGSGYSLIEMCIGQTA